MAKRKSPPATVPHITAPKPKFVMLGKSKYVHVAYSKAHDTKNSGCQMLRKAMVAGKIDYRGKHMSPEAARELDPCPNCDTAAALNALVTPEQRKAAGKAATEDTLSKVRDEQKRSKPKGKKVAARKDDKPTATKMVKSGPKSLGSDDEKANTLGAFAQEHGWDVTITPDKPGVMLVAKRGIETITCWFDGGKYDMSRCGYTEVEGSDWQGKLRAAHACRRQMSGEGRDRPHPKPGAGRSAPRGKREEPTPETESPEDARRRVPFSIDDDDLAIIDAIKGKVIRWRNGVSNSVEEAQLPFQAEGSKRAKIVITTHPTKATRILSFFPVEGISEHGEVYGGERNIRLDKIIRVVG